MARTVPSVTLKLACSNPDVTVAVLQGPLAERAFRPIMQIARQDPEGGARVGHARARGAVRFAGTDRGPACK